MTAEVEEGKRKTTQLPRKRRTEPMKTLPVNHRIEQLDTDDSLAMVILLMATIKQRMNEGTNI